MNEFINLLIQTVRPKSAPLLNYCAFDCLFSGAGDSDFDDLLYENRHRPVFCKNLTGDAEHASQPGFNRPCAVLDVFIMAPTFSEINKEALTPLMDNKISLDEAYTKAEKPIKEYMSKHTRQKDLALFMNYAKMKKPESIQDIPLTTMVPAYAISELKTAFQMGFMIFIPFLIIDMVVASVLMSMGMMMLPPVMISLPFKILLFVLVDGWYLIVKSLLDSF